MQKTDLPSDSIFTQLILIQIMSHKHASFEVKISDLAPEFVSIRLVWKSWSHNENATRGKTESFEVEKMCLSPEWVCKSVWAAWRKGATRRQPAAAASVEGNREVTRESPSTMFCWLTKCSAATTAGFLCLEKTCKIRQDWRQHAISHCADSAY